MRLEPFIFLGRPCEVSSEITLDPVMLWVRRKAVCLQRHLNISYYVIVYPSYFGHPHAAILPSYHVLPCHTMSYLLPFIVQAHVMMLDGMSCAGQELQCTIWQQPRRFPGGTVCKAFACFGIYVSFPLIILQTFENISL